MAIEPKRGCGYRKVGGLYMMGGKLAAPCCKMPVVLAVCPTCHGGVKQTRGWSWIDPRPWLKGECKEHGTTIHRWEGFNCAAADPERRLGNRVGLLWIGEKFYPTPEHFQTEAASLGISRRLSALPRGLVIGRDWVFLAHPRTMVQGERVPAAFALFQPTRIEKVVTKTQSEDEEAMADLDRRGIVPFVVPDDDRDHHGNGFDDVDDIGDDTHAEAAAHL